MIHNETNLQAKQAAGYAPDDTPCAPKRSAYTDDAGGTAAFQTALHKWEIFVSLGGVA